jgi:PEP-CTERM motif
MRTTILMCALALLGASGSASAATITFNGLLSPGPITTYVESGFTVSAVTGDWEARTGFGNPAPFIQFLRLATEPTITAQIEVSASGSPFSFASVDLYSSVTTIPYVITGLLGSSPVFTLSGTVPNTFGGFATVSAISAPVIDTLRIALSNPATACCGNPVGLDNIVVRAVPEPELLFLLGTGLAAIGARWTMKRRV